MGPPPQTHKDKKDPTVCSPRKHHFSFKNTHRLKVKVWERYSMKVETRRKQGKYTYIRQNGHSKKLSRSKKAITNDKLVNSSRKYNNCKNISTKYWSIQIYKTNTTNLKKESNITIVWNFNIPCSTMDTKSRWKTHKEILDLNYP